MFKLKVLRVLMVNGKRLSYSNWFKHHASLHFYVFVVFWFHNFIVPANLSLLATDAQQLPVFVERGSLADMQVLNSAPASRGVPLHGSHWARGTLSLFLPRFIFSFSPSLVLISSRSLSLSVLFSMPLVIGTPAVDPHRRSRPARHDSIPPARVQERRLSETRASLAGNLQPIISLE